MDDVIREIEYGGIKETLKSSKGKMIERRDARKVKWLNGEIIKQ